MISACLSPPSPPPAASPRPPPAPRACRARRLPPLRRRGAGSTPLESELLADAEDRILTRFDLLDAALVVGGAKDRRALDDARARLEARLAPPPQGHPPGRPAADGQAAAQALHTPPARTGRRCWAGTRPPRRPCRTCSPSRTFNCVSATILYLAAARELSLDARAVLLPSHARAAVVLECKHVIVETTSRLGFDASAETAREVASRFRSSGGGEPGNAIDLYADERGTEVDDLALLGVITTNLAVVAKQRGDLAAAEALDARAGVFVAPSARPLMRLVRASTLGELALLRLNEGRTAEAVDLAHQAAQLLPDGEEARLARHNLKALAQRRLAELARASEKELFAFAERFKAFPRWSGTCARGRGTWPAPSAASGATSRGRRRRRARRPAGVELARRRRARAQPGRRRAQPARRAGPQGPGAGLGRLREALVPRSWTRSAASWGGLAAQRAQRAMERGECEEVDRGDDWLVLDPTAPANPCAPPARTRRGWASGRRRTSSRRRAPSARRWPSTRRAGLRQNLSGALGNQVGGLLQARRCKTSPANRGGPAAAPRDELFKKAARFCAAR
jgi:hypothetical protein